MSIEFNLDKSIDEFLAFQHLYSNIGWTEGIHNRKYDEYSECPRNIKVNNGKEAVIELTKFKNKLLNYNKKIGILISSGIDSATIAKMLPENSYAFYATYVEREKDPEIDIVKKYCKINKLNLIIVDVSWKDYNDNIDYLMSVKKNPIHPCEIPVYMCCKKAKEMNINVLLSGWGADTHFGGMDKLISKDWKLYDFKKRYEYCPRIKEDNEFLDNSYKKFINKNNIINTQEFLTYNYHIMTIKSFFYLPELFGLLHLPLWGYIGLNHELNIKRVRNGEPKYVILEAFKILYKNDNINITNKIPFTIPTDIYMKEHFNDIKYHNKLKKYIDNNKNLSAQQLWMVYILNRFLYKIVKI